MTRTIVDAGPLVAFLNARDRHHLWAVETLRSLPTPLATCDPCLTEAAFLLGHAGSGVSHLFEMLESGALVSEFRLGDEVSAVREIMRRFKSLPASLADACLVRMSELLPAARVVTLDAHFRVYRRSGRRTIPLLMPE